VGFLDRLRRAQEPHVTKSLPAGTSPANGTEEEQIKPLEGSHAPARERYVDLYEQAQRLGRLALWDRAAPMLGLGTLLLGASIGAWVAEKKLSDHARLCLVAGLALLAGGLLLRDGRRREIRDLHEDMAKRLCLYDEDPTVKAIQEKYRRQEREAFEKTWRGLIVRAARRYLAYRRERR
jgi:hypothetical protein